MAKKLLSPEDAERLLRRRYELHCAEWMAGGGTWPLSLGLGKVAERDWAGDVYGVRAWVDAWRSYPGPGQLHWHEVSWARLGTQQLPARLDFAHAAALAEWLGERERFERAVARYAYCTAAWPTLITSRALAHHFDVLADYSEDDWARLTGLMQWLLENPASGHTLRAIPVLGLDTKWLDASRRSLLAALLRGVHQAEEARDFYALTGVSPLPARARLRILCPKLRGLVGGLSDVEAPLEELARLPVEPTRCLILENLESGWALGELEGCVAFVAMGNAVVRLGDLPWLRGVPAIYWGDLDTHGLAILQRARQVLGDVRSVLMDADTLLRYRALCVREPVQNLESELSALTPGERDVMDGLREQRWGNNLRLEQERIPWSEAWSVVRRAAVDVGPCGSARERPSEG